MFETALHKWHADAGGRMVEFAGWSMPIQYSSIVDEHHAVRKRVGMFDIAHMGRLWFRGDGTQPFLDRLLTNHVAKMLPGQVRYSLVCNEDGGILDDVLVYRFSDRYLLVVNASNREKIVQWIGEHIDEFDVEFHDETAESFMLALQGPQAQAVLASQTVARLEGLSYYNVTETPVCGREAVLSRTGYTGEDGFEVIVKLEDALHVWETLFAAGKDEGLTPCGLGCRDTLRLEAAMPLYGHEMDESIDPFTVNLGFAVKMSKEDFIGKPALEVIKAKGNLPQRVGVELEGRRIAREGSKLLVDEKQVGHVTSGTFSPTLEKAIGMGYIQSEFANPGSTVSVDIRGKSQPARIVALPFYKKS